MSARSRSRVGPARRLPGALGAQLRRLAGWAVASSLGAAVGCGEPAPAGGAGVAGGAAGRGPRGGAPSVETAGSLAPPRGDDWASMPCDQLLLVTDPVRPARPFDYFGVVGPLYFGKSRLLSDFGNPCQGASEREACIAKLNEIVAGQLDCRPPGPCRSITVLTAGDRVERHSEPAELHAVLGEIDTHSEAVVMAMVRGLMLTCVSADPIASSGTRVRPTESGYRVESQWDKCSSTRGQQAANVGRDGSVSAVENAEIMSSSCTVGRRPRGLELVQGLPGSEPLGEFLAEIAQLEAASVPAFERLAFDLQQLGAAEELSAAARASADDERRHALLTAALAHEYGGASLAPKLPARVSAPDALALALENAVEGCVRETFGALLAWHQAEAARDPRVAAVMAGIAVDESRHAELSWRIAEWLEPQLCESERALVSAAREAALRQLERELAADRLPQRARELIGLPQASVQRSLLDRMASQLALG